MAAHFTCRNQHRWGLSIDSPASFNPRWLCCPVCGAPPRPMLPVSAGRRLWRLLQRNPIAAWMVCSILVLLVAFAWLTIMQWRELDATNERLKSELHRMRGEASSRQQAAGSEGKAGGRQQAAGSEEEAENGGERK
jgi:hypothetical protein